MKAYELLANPASWIKIDLARDKNDRDVDPLKASKFCLYGALLRCYTFETSVMADRIRQRLKMSLTCWNDDPARTHEEVIQLLKELDI